MVQELLFFIKHLNLSLEILDFGSVNEYVKELLSFKNKNKHKNSTLLSNT